jgi:hypothetical protein
MGAWAPLLIHKYFVQHDVSCLFSDSIYRDLVMRGKWLRYLS